MMNRCRAGVRLTHLPTGESVTLSCDRNTHLPRMERHARAILAAKLCRPVEPPRPTRSYTVAPLWAAGIRQDGRRIVEGIEGVIEVFDGRSDVLPSRP